MNIIYVHYLFVILTFNILICETIGKSNQTQEEEATWINIST